MAVPDQSGESPEGPRFTCDAMLGDLARWLRAAGYDVAWEADIADAELIRRCLATGRILLTSDTGIMEHGIVRSGRVRALLVPHGLSKLEKLRHVLEAFDLELRRPRCMACGGRLERVPKASVKAEAPPRTFRWLDEFYRCRRCAKLFWRGTHWSEIRNKLASL